MFDHLLVLSSQLDDSNKRLNIEFCEETGTIEIKKHTFSDPNLFSDPNFISASPSYCLDKLKGPFLNFDFHEKTYYNDL